MKEKIIPQHNASISLNMLVDNLFFDTVGIIFYKNKCSSNCCLFNYNQVLYCYVYDNKDLLVLFKNKFEVFQCFPLQKLENSVIDNDNNLFKLLVLGKNGIPYFGVLNGKQFIIIKTKNLMENDKVIVINRPRKYIFLYNSKCEPCCIADISNSEFEIVIY
jgi:hypothetical protein